MAPQSLGARAVGGASGSGGSSNGAAAWNLVAADDPTDWKDDYAFLRSMDASLRCDLCYDIYTAPVSIKECAHTFCSACIRSAINKPGEEMGSRCPKCMNKNVYDSSLLPQPVLENAAQQWRVARPLLFAAQKQCQELKQKLEQQATLASTSAMTLLSDGADAASAARGVKRSASEMATSSTPPRRRRSARNADARQTRTPAGMIVVVDTTDDGEDMDDDIDDKSDGNWSDGDPAQRREKSSRSSPADRTRPANEEKEDASKDYRAMQATDLVQCPMCAHTYTYIALNVHLDKGTCQPGDPEPSAKERGLTSLLCNSAATSNGKQSGAWFTKASSSATAATNARPTNGRTHSPPPQAPRKKLVRPNYDMLRGGELKRLLDEWSLQTTGDRKRMVERHRMWVNLFNANLDASERMRKREGNLRKDLEMWERAQDEAARGGVSEKKAKTWAVEHRDDFALLAQQARTSHMRDRSKHGNNGDRKAEEVDEVDKAPIATASEIAVGSVQDVVESTGVVAEKSAGPAS